MLLNISRYIYIICHIAIYIHIYEANGGAYRKFNGVLIKVQSYILDKSIFWRVKHRVSI